MKATLRYETENASSFDTSGQKNVLVKEIFTNDINSLDELDSIDEAYLEDKFPDMLFSTKKEKKSFIKKVAYYIESFSANLSAFKDRELIKQINDSINYAGKDIDVAVDMIFESDTNVDLVNVKLTTAKLKAGGRKEETRIEYSLELFCMQLLGEKLYPGKLVRASIVYLKEDKFSKNYIATRHRITSESDNYFTDKVNALFSTDKYEENCSQTNCRMCSFKSLCNYVHNFEPLPVQEEIAVDLTDLAELPTINYTEEQMDVVDFKYGIGIVNAVAGSGKTATIVKRLAVFMKEYNVSPEDILILSFSENTIDEFKEKLANHHGILDFENIYTFNGFGDKILTENYGLFGFKIEPRLINKVEKMDLIKEILDSSVEITELDDIREVWNTNYCILKSVDYSNPFMRNGKNFGIAFHIEKTFDKIKSKGLKFSRDEFITEEILPFELAVEKSKLSDSEKDFVIDKYESMLNKIYTMYESYDFLLKSKGLYDYADQVNYLVYALNHPRLKDLFNYKHVVCDEFQDSNNLAMYILRRLTLSKDFKSLLVVGDINQAIYGFLGTTPENLLTFEKRFVNKVHKFDLSYSFRVPDKVAKGANALMNSSYQVKYNQMRAFRKDPGIISTFEDIETLVNSIKSAVAEDKTVGIIATTNMDLNIFIDMLVNNDIPYIVKSNLDVMKKDKVANLLSLSKFFVNPNNHTLEYAKYLQIADHKEFSKHFRTDSFNDYFKVKLDEILDAIDLKNPIELLEIYFELLSELAKQDYMIETFVNHLQRQRFKSIYDANDYCQKMSVYGLEVKAQENNVDCNVVVTTAHSSKGREFDMVIMDTSTFRAKSEEDRRLFYVAMTRAKESLYFINVERKGEDKKDCGAFLEAITKSLNN